MAWAVFLEKFRFDRRPKAAVAFEIQATDNPQRWPRDVIDAAVAAGKAVEVKPPGKPKTPTGMAKKQD